MEKVHVSGDRTEATVIVTDHDVARFVESTAEADRVDLVRRGMKIGLTSLSHVGTTVNADYVKREFESLAARFEKMQTEAADALTDELQQQFGDRGRLPAALETYLGDKGKVKALLDELFDENRRSSALGRMRDLFSQYFDGDGSTFAKLLDPARHESPLHPFATDMEAALSDLHDRLVGLEKAGEARRKERAKGTAKGTDFEDDLEVVLGDMAHGSSDRLERTGTTVGSIPGCKKGDFVISLSPATSPNVDLRIVIESKDATISMAALQKELRVAKENRGALVGVAVIRADLAPAGVAPLLLHGHDIFTVFEPGQDPIELEASIRLARALALVITSSSENGADAAAVRQCLDEDRGQIESIASLRRRLNAASGAVADVSDALSDLRAVLLSRLVDLERAILDGSAASGAAA